MSFKEEALLLALHIQEIIKHGRFMTTKIGLLFFCFSILVYYMKCLLL